MIGSIRRRQHSVLVGAVGGAITATGSDDTRTVFSIVALLAVVGVGLFMLAMWLFRVTRPDHELLAPLEVMGDRKWRRGDPVWQRRRLDEVRPADAAPFRPAAAPPAIDASYDAGPTAPGFEDLSDRHHADGGDDGDGGDDSAAGSESAAGAADGAAVDLEVEGEHAQTELTEGSEPDDPAPADQPVSTGIETGDANLQAGDLADQEAETSPTVRETPNDSSAPEVAPPEERDGDGDVGDVGADAKGADDTDDTDDTIDTIDGGLLLGGQRPLSDDVSSTPPFGGTRAEFATPSPSADPDATLADLVAAAEEPPPLDEGSDDPVRSAE